MKTVAKRLLTVVLITLMGISCAQFLAADWQSDGRNTWVFKTQYGEVKIVLLKGPSSPNVWSLEILYEGDAHPSVAEEVNFLREVLHELPTHGIDSQNLRALSMRGFAEPEVRERVAIAALHSKAWRSYTKVVGGAETVVKDLLNDLKAYDAFNEAFEEHGLVVRLKGAEKVAGEKCMNLKLRDSDCNVRHNPRLPVGANLEFDIQKRIESSPAKSGP